MGSFFFPFVVFGFLGSVLPLALTILLIIAVLGGRYEDDPDRERPRAVYLASACFVALVTIIGAVFMFVTALLGLTNDSESFAFASDSATGRVTARAPAFDEDGNLIERGEFAQDEPFEEPEFEERQLGSILRRRRGQRRHLRRGHGRDHRADRRGDPRLPRPAADAAGGHVAAVRRRGCT